MQDYKLYLIQIAIAVVSVSRAMNLSITAGLEQLGLANRAGVLCSSPGESSHSVSCRIEAVSAPYRMIGGSWAYTVDKRS